MLKEMKGISCPSKHSTVVEAPASANPAQDAPSKTVAMHGSAIMLQTCLHVSFGSCFGEDFMFLKNPACCDSLCSSCQRTQGATPSRIAAPWRDAGCRLDVSKYTVSSGKVRPGSTQISPILQMLLPGPPVVLRPPTPNHLNGLTPHHLPRPARSL
jgi:hypothetical protein